MAIRAVVFDLDDTLAVTRRDRATLLAEAVEETDAPPLTRSDYRRVLVDQDPQETRAPIFETLLDEVASADPDPAPEELAAAYRGAIGEAIEPVDGAERLLDSLAEKYRLGLVTDGPVRAGREKLAALGWTDRFDAAVVTGEVGVGKPDPRGFLAALDELGVAPEEAVYVGNDPELDVAGAAEAGMAAVQVTYPGGHDPDPQAVTTVRRDALAEALPAVLAEELPAVFDR